MALGRVTASFGRRLFTTTAGFVIGTAFVVQAAAPTAAQWALWGAIVAAGMLAGLIPGVRAYRLSLADGLSPRS